MSISTEQMRGKNLEIVIILFLCAFRSVSLLVLYFSPSHMSEYEDATIKRLIGIQIVSHITEAQLPVAFGAIEPGQ